MSLKTIVKDSTGRKGAMEDTAGSQGRRVGLMSISSLPWGGWAAELGHRGLTGSVHCVLSTSAELNRCPATWPVS